MIEPITTFLNVDLHVRSSSNLQPLIDAMEVRNRASTLWSQSTGRTRHAIFEVGRYRARTIDAVIREFARLIRALPTGPRRVWEKASRRDLNIGIQAGLKGETYSIDAKTVKIAADLGARIVFTVYGAKVNKLRLRSSS